MVFINIFFVSFFCSFSLLSAGKLFNNLFIKSIKVNFFENLIFGFILLSFIGLFLNFFFSLNEKLNLIFIFIPCILYFFINKKELKNDLIFLLLISLITVILISLDNTNRPDAGLYHLPFISILNESNLIVGLSNIHFRFGHISVIQYTSAIYNNILFSDNGILVPPSIIYLSLVGYLVIEAIKRNEDYFYSFLGIIFASYALINMNRYSSWGNDDFASILVFIIILNCYQNFLKFNLLSFTKILLFCSVTFLIKSFYLIIFLLPLVLFFKNFKNLNKKFFLNKINIFNFIFIILWFIKNFLTSSCIIFPVTFLCFDIFSWSMNDISIQNINLISEAWAKDWPNNKIFSNYDIFIKNFNWLSTWINNHLIIIIKNISVLLTLIIIIRIFKNINLKNIQKKFINTFSIILFFLLLIWFIKFPLLRYGEGIIVGFFVIISFYIKFPTIKIFKFNFAILLILFISTGLLLKNLIRIKNNYNNYYIDYPWPKKNSYTHSNSKNEYNVIKKNGNILYYVPKIGSRLCMYGPSPCAAIGVNETYFKMDKMLINKGNFLFFDMYYIENKV